MSDRTRTWLASIVLATFLALGLGYCTYTEAHCDGKVVRGVIGLECVDP